MKVKNKLPFQIDLQLFADGGMFSGGDHEGNPFYESEPSDPTPEPIGGDGEGGSDPTPEPTPQDPPPTDPPPIDPQPGTTDPPQPNGDFNIQQYLQNLRNDINNDIASKFEELKPQDPPPPQLTPEEIQAQEEAENQELIDKLYSNPKEVLNKIKEETRLETLQEIQQKQQAQQEAFKQQQQVQQKYDSQLQEFISKNEDVPVYIPKMMQLLQSKPHLQQSENPFEEAYKMAKFDDLSSQPKTLEDMLSNPENLQKVLDNPDIKKAFLEGLKNSNAPQVINSQRGTPPATPPHKAKGWGEATKNVLSKNNW